MTRRRDALGVRWVEYKTATHLQIGKSAAVNFLWDVPHSRPKPQRAWRRAKVMGVFVGKNARDT